MSKRYKVREGIVIRRKSLPSGDTVVTIFSEDGKWSGVARKGKRLGGSLSRLSLFHDVVVQYYHRNEDDLALITQVQLSGALAGLSKPDIYPYAHVLAELTDKLTVDVHLGENIFSYLASGLRGLARHEKPETVALVYAWKLLQQAGLSPTLRRCVVCGRAADATKFDIAAGGLTCREHASGMELPPEVVVSLQTILHRTVREGLESPIDDLGLHWTLLSRYLAYHVGELKSIGSLSHFRLANGAARSS